MSILKTQEIVDGLEPLAICVLAELGSADDFGYRSFKWLERQLHRSRADIKAAVDQLRSAGLVEFANGLMTEDGEMAGSGYARSDDGERLMQIFSAIEESLRMRLFWQQVAA